VFSTLSAPDARIQKDVPYAMPKNQADRLDLAHLLAEMGLVLCSVTILTKRKDWWRAGIISAALALAVVGSMYLIPHDHPESSHETPHDSPAKAKEDAGHH